MEYPASGRPGAWVLYSWAGCSSWKKKLLGFRWPQLTTQHAPPRLLYSEITQRTEERVAGCLNLGPTLGTASLLYSYSLQVSWRSLVLHPAPLLLRISHNHLVDSAIVPKGHVCVMACICTYLFPLNCVNTALVKFLKKLDVLPS